MKLLFGLTVTAKTLPVLPTEAGVLPTWALVAIAVGAAIIAGLVFWFIKKREK